MGWVLAMGKCYVCGHMFVFDPDRVPSMAVNDVRRPLCRDCVTELNPARVLAGLPAITVIPGAYGPDEFTEE